MPTSDIIFKEVMQEDNQFLRIVEKYINELSEHTGNNTIIYYSNFLEVSHEMTSINDNDMPGFMQAFNAMDKSKQLDIILHTPGGEISATEGIVDYIQQLFGNNYRVIVPHLAMSAGTMIACSANEIVMGKHSSLGPIDPQIMGLSVQAILDEFEHVFKDIEENPERAAVWNVIMDKYPPTIYQECIKANELTEEIVGKWLENNMYSEYNDPKKSATNTVSKLGSKQESKTHSRHISLVKARSYGLNIKELESDEKFQDLVLSIHHSTLLMMERMNVVKAIKSKQGTYIIQVT